MRSHARIYFRDSLVKASHDRLRQLAAETNVGSMNTDNSLFRQLYDGQSSTYTYLLADMDSKEALLIDPVVEQVERDVKLLSELDLKLVYAVNTHVHADHITGSGELKKAINECKSVISAASRAKADRHLSPGDVFGVGKVKLEARATPGHTDGMAFKPFRHHVYSNLGQPFFPINMLPKYWGRFIIVTQALTLHCIVFVFSSNIKELTYI